MKIKANLHFHTKDDVEDKEKAAMVADYDLFRGLDEAKRLGFDILAVTCHDFVADDPKYYEYARKLGINLISGVEKRVEGKDVLILNAVKAAERVETFDDLKKYRADHPESFIMAPHPFFDGGYSLGKKLVKYIDLFDAIECSWFHFKFIDLNIKACDVARRHRLPFIATSDAHDLAMLGTSYTVVDAENSSTASVLEALRAGRFMNVSPAARFWSTYVWGIIGKTALGLLKSKRSQKDKNT